MRKMLLAFLTVILLMPGCIYIPSVNTGGLGGSPPVITLFDAKPGVIKSGERAELSWSVTGATSVSIDNGVGEVALSGSRMVAPTATTIYKITAVNSAGTNFATAQVICEGASPSSAAIPTINSFTVSRSAVLPQTPVLLSWNVSNASSASIDQGVGTVDPVSGTVTVAPAVSTTYTISAANASGTAVSRLTVTVTGTSPMFGLPVINSFEANNSVVLPGTGVRLSWNVTNSTQTSISSGGSSMFVVDPVSSMVVTPLTTTTYTLSANNAVGTVSQSIIITVSGSASGQTQTGQGYYVFNLLPAESGSLIKNMTTYIQYGAVCAGDTMANLASRAFLSFDISSIPAQAVVEEAVLDLGGYTIIGNPSYTSSNWGNMGALEVYSYQYGVFASLGRLGYEATAPLAGSLRIDEITGAPMKIDVTNDSSGSNIIQKLLAERQGRCQFRVQFFTSTNWNSLTDMICMENAVLRVKYRVP